MFTPRETTERFDRNIFNVNNTHETTKLSFAPETPVLFYYKSTEIVGHLTGKQTVVTYTRFQRNGYIPISLMHESKEYCGWVAESSLLQ